MSLPLTPLSGVRGQDPAVEALAALLHPTDPVPPLLLHGPEGVGKRTAALAFAASLVCRRPQGIDACGTCPACHRVADADTVTVLREGSSSQDSTMVYPDVGLVSLPRGKTRLSVLQARDVVQSMSSRPYELPRRIYIVDPAERMNASAANSLLKVLEEPPSYGVLMIVTGAPWSLPITVRSRLRPLRFRPLATPVVEELLVASAGLPRDEAVRRAARANGSISRALTGDPEAEGRLVAAWAGVLERLASGSARPGELAAAASETLATDAESALVALDALLVVLRDLAAAEHGSRPVLLDEEQAQALAPYAGALLGAAGERPALVDRLRREVVTYNRNPRLALEGAVLALAGVLRARDLPAV